MQFEISIWRKDYDEVHRLSEILRDSKPYVNDFGRTLPPVACLSKDAQKAIEYKIKSILTSTSKYLDKCGIAIRYSKRKKF